MTDEDRMTVAGILFGGRLRQLEERGFRVVRADMDLAIACENLRLENARAEDYRQRVERLTSNCESAGHSSSLSMHNFECPICTTLADFALADIAKVTP